MSDKDTLAEILAFPGVDLPPELPATVERPPSYGEGHCFHDRHRLVLDEETHTVTCSGCKRPLDPYDGLKRFARDWDAIATRAEKARADTDRAVDRLTNLLHQEKLAKARRAKAVKATPAEIALADLAMRAARLRLRILGMNSREPAFSACYSEYREAREELDAEALRRAQAESGDSLGGGAA